MHSLISWLKNNLSNFFTVVGILLTIYFSIFYIPGYVREAKSEKIRNINSDLTETIQELVYNQQEIDEGDIKTLIKGKEIKHNITYTYSIDELLIQTQEQFMANRFIPLEERKKLVDKIDTIRLEIKPTDEPPKAKEKQDIVALILSYVSVLLGAIVSALGAWSLGGRLKKEKEAKIEESIESEKESIADYVKSGFHYGAEVEKALNEIGVNFSSSTRIRGMEIDFIVHANDEDSAIEVKYLKSKAISSRIIGQLQNLAVSLKMPVYLVTNTRIPMFLNNQIDDFNNSNHRNPIHIIKAETREELLSKFKNIFKITQQG